MVFCNKYVLGKPQPVRLVTILILIDDFLQYMSNKVGRVKSAVTILILIDDFLQYHEFKLFLEFYNGHNPYFNR